MESIRDNVRNLIFQLRELIDYNNEEIDDIETKMLINFMNGKSDSIDEILVEIEIVYDKYDKYAKDRYFQDGLETILGFIKTVNRADSKLFRTSQDILEKSFYDGRLMGLKIAKDGIINVLDYSKIERWK